MNELTIQIVDGKIKLASASGFITELTKAQLESLDFDIWSARWELEEYDNPGYVQRFMGQA